MRKSTIKELRDSLQKLTLPRIQKEVERIIKTDTALVDRKQWEFYRGLDPINNPIGAYASYDYELYKIQLNPLAGGKVDLILTGATKDALRVVALGNREFYLESTDWKWGHLVQKYGERITVINKDFFVKLQREVYAPKLIEALKRYVV